MKTVYCKNKHLNSSGQQVECGRYLGTITERQILALRLDEDERAVFRCPTCKPEQRWIYIGMVDGKLTFEAGDEQPAADGLEYDDIINFEQVG